VVKELLGSQTGSPKPAKGLSPCFDIAEETNYDLFAWLECAFRESNRPTESLEKFKAWVQDKLIVGIAVHPRRGNSVKELCGLSLFVPETEAVRGVYSDYPIYQDSLLNDLWNVLYPIKARHKKESKPEAR